MGSLSNANGLENVILNHQAELEAAARDEGWADLGNSWVKVVLGAGSEHIYRHLERFDGTLVDLPDVDLEELEDRYPCCFMAEGDRADLVSLLTAYGQAKFGDRWWPGQDSSSALARELDAPETNHHRLIELYGEYGEATFGDEWWPGEPGGWLKKAEAAELVRLLNICDGMAES